MATAMGLSVRGAANVDAILPRISAAVEERAKKENTNIDLGTSENWLIRDELIALSKDAVRDGLISKAREALSRFCNCRLMPQPLTQRKCSICHIPMDSEVIHPSWKHWPVSSTDTSSLYFLLPQPTLRLHPGQQPHSMHCSTISASQWTEYWSQDLFGVSRMQY